VGQRTVIKGRKNSVVKINIGESSSILDLDHNHPQRNFVQNLKGELLVPLVRGS
jgi:hypothetical protein